MMMSAVAFTAAAGNNMRGDCNQDGSVNIADVTCLINYLLSHNASAIDLTVADCDQDGNINIADVTCLINRLLSGGWPEAAHEWVDLGLPSGTLWATCNIGADNPEDYGDYFAWGETEPKEQYDWTTYKWCNGSYNTLTKYCSNSDYGANGFVDNKKELDPEDDAAYVNWGPSWRMPTIEQLKELCERCTWQWTTRNGVNGQLVTGPNGKTMFLPAAGYPSGGSLITAGSYGYYRSRTLYSDWPCYAYFLRLDSDDSGLWGYNQRSIGWTVRAVRVSEENHDYIDLGLPSGTLWATCNIGADNPEEYGDYFAWGETAPKINYSWSTYKWCNDSLYMLTKYCTDSSYGYNGFVDNKTELDPEDDAAYVNWGPSWSMPTKEQLDELREKCTWTWTAQNNVNGRLVTGPNGNTLFLPATGSCWNDSVYSAGSWGYYWSRTLYSTPCDAYNLSICSSHWNHFVHFLRYRGYTLRAVRASQN